MTLMFAVSLVLAATSSLDLGQQHQADTHPARVYTVCEVLEQLKALNGTMVAIRGVILGGPHGTLLCGSCSPHLTTKGFTWPDTVSLTGPSTSRHPFEFDVVAHTRVKKAIKRLHPRQGDQVILTYVGMLETRDLAESVSIDRNGRVVGFGFGPGNDAPAQLIVKTVRDPEIVRHKK